MSDRRSQALIANAAFFNALPGEARRQVVEKLGDIAQEILQAQQAQVPVYKGPAKRGVVPGLLKQSLTIEEAFEHLRVRVGLPQLKGRRSRLFYGVIMEYGRQARTVAMRRLKQGSRSEWNARKRAGTARASLKPDDLLSAARSMRVGRIEPRPYVHLEDRFAIAVARAEEEVIAALTSGASA